MTWIMISSDRKIYKIVLFKCEAISLYATLSSVIFLVFYILGTIEKV